MFLKIDMRSIYRTYVTHITCRGIVHKGYRSTERSDSTPVIICQLGTVWVLYVYYSVSRIIHACFGAEICIVLKK
jgi:hypothetical protein